MEENIKLPVDESLLAEFTRILQKYKAGKASVERRAVAAENWWKLRNSAEERALLFATHTPDDAARLFSRVLLLNHGRLVLDTPLDPAHPPVSLSATVTGWLLDLAT